MTYTPGKQKILQNSHKSNTPEDKDVVITRLLDEVRFLHKTLLEVRYEISRADVDFDRMTVVGGIKRLAKDRREAQEEVIKLNKELDKLVRNSK